jgi:D-lactate dehydrogenase (cytochrome)
MNRILGMRGGEDGLFYLRVQPGVALLELSKCVESKKFVQNDWDKPSREAYASFLKAGEYFFPPDPTERSASLGGMAACNASGARTYLYGATRNYISALRIMLSAGRTVACPGRVPGEGLC